MPQEAFEADVVEFARAVGQLVRRVRAAAGSQALSWTEAGVLKRLASDGPATTAELARAEGVRPQSMGTVVATLAGMGLVGRTPHPTDGRRVVIAATAKGAAVRKAIRDAKRTWLARAVGRLDRRDRDALFAAGEIMRRLAGQ